MRKNLTITAAKVINGGKIQLEFQQELTLPNAQPKNILSLMNASDERFKQSNGKAFAWMSGEPSDISALFKIKLDELVNPGDSIELKIVNPKIQDTELNIQLVETTNGTDYDNSNIEKTAKRAGKDGDYIVTADGEFIFRKTTVVMGNPQHVILKETVRHNAANAAVEDAI